MATTLVGKPLSFHPPGIKKVKIQNLCFLSVMLRHIGTKWDIGNISKYLDNRLHNNQFFLMQYVALKQKGLKSILNPFGHFEKKKTKE